MEVLLPDPLANAPSVNTNIGNTRPADALTRLVNSLQSPPAHPDLNAAPLRHRCLALTGSLETSLPYPDCFAGVAGDFDGQGISLGVCQWNLGRGTLQPLLRYLQSKHPQLIDQIFSNRAVEFRAMIAAPRIRQLDWARSIQTGEHQIAVPWAELLRCLGITREFQQIQTAAAAEIFDRATGLCGLFNLVSQRALALMFDISVQNGGIPCLVRAQIRQDFADLKSPSAVPKEVARLQVIANRCAEAADQRWVEDVRIRKLTIATGSGIVHGRPYELGAQYGITLNPFMDSI